jgi:hypothetical protein
MKVLAEETWSWMLLEHNGELLFSVLCGGVAMYGIEFALSESEAFSYQQQGENFLRSLARDVTGSPSVFRPRQLPAFDALPGLQEAVAKWRASRAVGP